MAHIWKDLVILTTAADQWLKVGSLKNIKLYSNDQKMTGLQDLSLENIECAIYNGILEFIAFRRTY